MKTTIHTLAYDTRHDGTGCQVYGTEAELKQELKTRIEEFLKLPRTTLWGSGDDGKEVIAEIHEAINEGEILEAWDLWECHFKPDLDTYLIEEHEIEVPDVPSKVREGFPVTGFCEPEGPSGKTELPVVHWSSSIQCGGPYLTNVGAHADWYNDRLQICIDDGINEDPAVKVATTMTLPSPRSSSVTTCSRTRRSSSNPTAKTPTGRKRGTNDEQIQTQLPMPHLWITAQEA